MYNFRTYNLAVQFYKDTQKIILPKHLKDQLDRSSSSISLNLAEGNAKFSFKDKARFYQMAYGSLRESQTILMLANIQDEKLLSNTEHLARSLYRLVQGTTAKSKV